MGFTSKTGCGIFLKNRLWGLPQKQVVGFTSKAGCGVYLKTGCGIYLKNRLWDLPQKTGCQIYLLCNNIIII